MGISFELARQQHTNQIDLVYGMTVIRGPSISRTTFKGSRELLNIYHIGSLMQRLELLLFGKVSDAGSDEESSRCWFLQEQVLKRSAHNNSVHNKDGVFMHVFSNGKILRTDSPFIEPKQRLFVVLQ